MKHRAVALMNPMQAPSAPSFLAAVFETRKRVRLTRPDLGSRLRSDALGPRLACLHAGEHASLGALGRSSCSARDMVSAFGIR